MAENQNFGGLGGLSQGDRDTLNTEVMGLNTNQAFGLGDLGKASIGTIANQVAPAIGNVLGFVSLGKAILLLENLESLTLYIS
jgi:hypothetical protein